MRKITITAFLLFSLSINAFAQEKLVFAIDIIRHGDRTPTADIPTAPHQWPEGLGQLTAKGMQQEYQLGAALRKKYIDQEQLLSPHYATGSVYARSSDVDRTLMSAQSFLMGLYPLGTGPNLPGSTQPALPGGYQPLSIHTVAKDQETLLIAWTESPLFKEYLKKYVYTTDEWKTKLLELAPKFARWSEATGITITDLFQLKSLGDTLYIDQLYQVPLPEDLSPEEAQEIIDAGRWVFVTAFKSPAIGKVTGSDLLAVIAKDLQQASQQTTPLKYKLYSSHDSTQLSLMSAMETPLSETPPYASDLNFSLYDTGHQNYVVKVSFNDKPVTISKCGGDVCTLSQFIALFGKDKH